VIRVHRIPFSTNVERVALGCALKGVPVEWIDHDPGRRGELLRLSGQELTPVAEFGADVLVDSIAILRRLDREYPQPRLFPGDPTEWAVAELFVEWFNEVWKRPPNALASASPPTGAEAEALADGVRAWSRRFERMLSAREFLLGDRIGIADVCAYPFLRYARDDPSPGDGDPFHAVLRELLAGGSDPCLDRWIVRVESQPPTPPPWAP